MSTTVIKGIADYLSAETTDVAAIQAVVDVTKGGVIYQKGTGTEATNAVTINKPAGKITTSALTTAAGASYTITLTNSAILSTSYLMVTAGTYSGTLGTNGVPRVNVTAIAAGSATIVVSNSHASNALSGTQIIYFQVI
jgi:hypothetical protein